MYARAICRILSAAVFTAVGIYTIDKVFNHLDRKKAEKKASPN